MPFIKAKTTWKQWMLLCFTNTTFFLTGNDKALTSPWRTLPIEFGMDISTDITMCRLKYLREPWRFAEIILAKPYKQKAAKYLTKDKRKIREEPSQEKKDKHSVAERVKAIGILKVAGLT